MGNVPPTSCKAKTALLRHALTWVCDADNVNTDYNSKYICPLNDSFKYQTPLKTSRTPMEAGEQEVALQQ